MVDECWLIFNKKGIRRMAKGRRSSYHTTERPALDAGEYAVLVKVNAPDNIFNARPLPTAMITLPESAVVTPSVQVDVQNPPTSDEAAADATA